MPKKFYGVFRGRNCPKVFNNWSDAAKAVTGFKGAVYKGFSTEDEATEFALGGYDSMSRKRPSSSGERPKCDIWELYTDGGCTGNRNTSKVTNQPAGWGVVVMRGGKVFDELHGPVELDPKSERFLGAEICSNNTGELSAIAEALIWLRTENTDTPARILYDSVYAANITTKIFKAAKNKELALKCQTLYDEVRGKRKLEFTKVKAHSGDVGNERADELAELGKSGKRTPRRTFIDSGIHSVDDVSKKQKRNVIDLTAED